MVSDVYQIKVQYTWSVMCIKLKYNQIKNIVYKKGKE